MQKLILILLGATAIAGSLVQTADASDRTRFRRAYDQLRWDDRFAGPATSAIRAQELRNIQNFGFSGRDPTRPGGWDPSLRPPS
jgi:hypothetical protein